MGPLFGPVDNLLQGALQGLDLKSRIVAQNIANLETPGYKAQTVDFAHTLQQALASGSVGAQVVASPGAARNDGNTVNLEQQLGLADQVAMAQEGVMSLIDARLKTADTVVSDLSTPGV